MRARQPEQVLGGAKEAAVKLLKARHLSDDAVGWAHETLNVYLWSKQREIITALDDYNRVAVRSCHDSGKSFVAAVIAARWLSIHPAGQARVITTAPTATQVRGILWVEINQLHEKASLVGRVNQTEWWIGSYLAGIGRKPADYRPEAFQGLHARYPLIIIDEASGVSAALVDAAETLATNVNAKMLLIGNPDDPTSIFADIHANPDKHGYHTIKISAWDTPNFTQERHALLMNPDPAARVLPEVLLSPQWVEGRRKAWGEEHPFWHSKVEAEFPKQDQAAIVRIADLIRARIPLPERVVASAHAGEATDGSSRSVASPQVSPQIALALLREWPPTLGVDVAGSDAGDETCVRLILSTAHRSESATPTSMPLLSTANAALMPTTEWRVRSAEPQVIADTIVEAIVESGARRVAVDSIGVGFGIIGLVRNSLHLRVGDLASRLVKVFGVNNAQKAYDSTQFVNLRAELWWTFGRILLASNMIDTSIADNLIELEAQLLMPRYKIVKGRIQVEAKDEIKARLGRSPDNADALIYGLAPLCMRGVGVATVARPPAGKLDPRGNAFNPHNNPTRARIPIGHERFGTQPQHPVMIR